MTTEIAAFLPDVRKAMRAITYGLYVLTAAVDGQVHAATVSWVMQTSFKPRMVAVGLKRETRIYEEARRAGVFCLNVVGEGQNELAATFFKFVEADSTAQSIGGYPYTVSEEGIAALHDAAAWIDCKVVEEVGQQGDHALLLCEVTAGRVNPARKPLALRDTPWSYGG